MVDFGTILSTEARDRPVFDQSQPYYLSSNGTLEPTEMLAPVDSAEPQPDILGPESTQGTVPLPHLPAIPSRIRWDLISNP